MKNASPFVGLLLLPLMTLPGCGKDEPMTTTGGETTGGESGMEEGGEESAGETSATGDGDSGDGDSTTTTTGDGDGDGDGTCADMGTDPFRIVDMWFRDPHFYVDVPFVGCSDLTDGGVFVVNDELNDAIDNDDASGDGDGLLDLSIMQIFHPLAQGGGCSGDVEVGTADCVIPADNTVCSPTPGVTLDMGTYTAMSSGACLTPDPGHLSSEGYNPQPDAVSGPCYHATVAMVTVDLAGIQVPLTDVELAGTFDADPANTLGNGILKGFMSETVADATILPPELPLLGGSPISSLLPGGNGNCAAHDDRDMHNGESGWWFYAEFVADRTPWNP